MLKVRIDGLRECEAALGQLTKATGKNVLRRILKQRSEPIARVAAARAPDDPKTGGKDLRSSIGAGTKLSRRQAGLHKKWGSSSAVEYFIGAGALPQAHLQEFGSSIHGAQPFLRPAWDGARGTLLDNFAEDLWSEIEKAAARAAKKAAKAAAAGG